MRDRTIRTVLDALFRIPKIPPAALTESIKRTITKQTIEMIGIYPLVAGEELTFPVAEKFIVLGFFFIHNQNYKSILPPGP